MPELPDVEVYIAALRERIVDQPISKVRVAKPFVVRSYDPPIRTIEGETVRALRRIGKRIVFELTSDLFVVIHLMIAGRFRWEKPGAKIPRKLGLFGWEFPEGMLLLTEAGTKRRASIHIVKGEDALAELDPGGIDVMSCSLETFTEALVGENRTMKRRLTDPRVFSGIGNAYSDEILHRAQISPIKWTTRLTDEEIERLLDATKTVLREWWERLDAERMGGFPKKVTAFREEMAVHGKYKQPCPVCHAPVQRIVRGESEINYCAACQTGGKVLADRAMSKLLKGDWPRTIDEWEAMGKR